MRLFFCNSSRASSKRGDYREVRSRITKYICSAPPTNLLSVLDPSSLASGIAVLFDSRTEAKQFASLVAQNTKTPEGVSVFWAPSADTTCLVYCPVRLFWLVIFNQIDPSRA